MREHADYYKFFIDTLSGASQRRNPKRKTTKAYSSAQAVIEVSPEELDRVFESHLQQMAKGGTYGDNMEISAFSNAYDVDVKIYQRDFAYVVSPNFGGDGEKDMVHIAYHVGIRWQDYR
jgi:OTU domain-containing protein 3